MYFGKSLGLTGFFSLWRSFSVGVGVIFDDVVVFTGETNLLTIVIGPSGNSFLCTSLLCRLRLNGRRNVEGQAVQVYLPSTVKVFDDAPWVVFICCFNVRFLSHKPQTGQDSQPLMMFDVVVKDGVFV